MAEFLAGVAATVVALVPAAVVTILVARWLLRSWRSALAEADHWRAVAANATIAARLAEEGGEDEDDDALVGG